MDYKKWPDDLLRKIRDLERVIKTQLPRDVAVEAREHFVDNFRRGGFVNGGLRKWPNVKRRDPSSGWYGFEYRGDKAGKGSKGRGRKANFSQTATQRSVLTSKRNYLMQSLRASSTSGRAIISTDAPHAEIHNNGGTFKVFGKATATMPKRQFIGQSAELDKKIEQMIINQIDTIFK